MSAKAPGMLARLAVVLLGAVLALLVLWNVVAPRHASGRPEPGFILVFGALLAACQLVLTAWALAARLSELAVGACWLWLFAAAGLWLLIGMPMLMFAGRYPGGMADILGFVLGGAVVLALPAGAAWFNLPRWRRYALPLALWSAAVAALALSRAREPRMLPLEAGTQSPQRTAETAVPRFPAALPLAVVAAMAAVAASVRLARRPLN